MTRPPTLSQSFDSGDFIAPDILSAVNASVRAVAAGLLEREGLAGDMGRLIDLSAEALSITDTTLSGLVPSMNPDEFMPYERPKAPFMAGFDEIAKEEPETGLVRKEPEEAKEIAAGTGARPEEKAEDEFPDEFDSLNVEVVIPDLVTIEQTAELIEDDIDLAMPEVSRFNANLFKVKLDTLRFNKEFMKDMRLIVLIVVIAIVNVLLIMYLLS